MGKKEETGVGTEVGEGVQNNPTQILPYLCGILFNSFPYFTPDTQPLRLLKMMYNTKRSWNRQSESVNVRPNWMANTQLNTSPVAGPILHGGNSSPNLQARFCKLYPADFSVAIYLFVSS